MEQFLTARADLVKTLGARPPALHELKCWPPLFEAIVAGRKRHDLRRATDRDFRVGDQLLLREFDPDIRAYTGRRQLAEVTYITSAGEPCALSDVALHADFCILSIRLEDSDQMDQRAS